MTINIYNDLDGNGHALVNWTGAGNPYVVINSSGAVPTVAGLDGIGIGLNAFCNSANGIALGRLAQVSSGIDGIAIGNAAQANAEGVIAIGDTTQISQTNVVAIGNAVTANGTDSVVIGNAGTAEGADCLVIGRGAITEASSDDCIALGRNAACGSGYAPTADSIAIGRAAIVDGASQDGIALGRGATSANDFAVQIGPGTNTDNDTIQFQTVSLANNRVVTPLSIESEGTTTVNAVNGALSPVDVSGGIATVNPPGTPQSQDTFAVTDSRANAAVNNITVDFTTAGDNFHGAAATDYVINVNRGYAQFLYVNATIGWVLTNA